MPLGTARSGARNWPRKIRVTIYVVLIFFALVLMAMIVGIAQFFIGSACSSASPGRLGGLCSENMQVFVVLLTLALIAGAYFPLLRFTTRTLAINKDSSDIDPETGAMDKNTNWLPVSTRLPFGQNLVTGTVDVGDGGQHRVMVEGFVLRFWGGLPIRQRVLAEGQRAAFVYQRDSLFGTNFVLAFWEGGNSPIRGVGGAVHFFVLLLSVVGVGLVPIFNSSYPPWLVPVCTALFAVSGTYSLLLFLAKRAMRNAISGQTHD